MRSSSGRGRHPAAEAAPQMAFAWVLRGGRVTSALVGATCPERVDDCVGALKLAEINRHVGGEVDQSTGKIFGN